MQKPAAEDCLLVKTASEISLKSPFVRRHFTKKLVQSIKFALKRNKVSFSSIARGGGRLYVFCQNSKKAQKILLTVSGIHATALAKHFTKANYAEIEKQAIAFAKGFLKKGDTFALDASVSPGAGFSGTDLEFRLGAAIQKEISGLKVKLKQPEKEICIEITKKDFFFYSAEQKCLGGLPLGAEGSTAFFFEGKKDELPAAFLLMHRGCNIFPIVKKKSAKLEKFLQKLVPFNDYRQFALTEEKLLPELIQARGIKALATADSKVDAKSLAAYSAFDKNQGLVVLRPLLLYPMEKKKELQKFFH